MYDMVSFFFLCEIPFLWVWCVKKKKKKRRQQLIRRGTGLERATTRCLHKVTYLYMLRDHRKAENPNPSKTSLVCDMKRWLTWMWFHLGFVFFFPVQLTLLAHTEIDAPANLQSSIFSCLNSQSAFNKQQELMEGVPSDFERGEGGCWVSRWACRNFRSQQCPGFTKNDENIHMQRGKYLVDEGQRSEWADWLETIGRQ